jgi:hypothetical protein
MSFLKQAHRVGCVLLVLVLGGCSPEGPEVVPVEGVATLGGEPVPNLELNFFPEEGRPSWGVTDAKGRFKLNYTRGQDGARVGKHRVTVRGGPPASAAEEISGRAAESPEVALLRQKFATAETTPLVIEITKPTKSLEVSLD